MTATMTAEAPAALDEPARHPLDWLADPLHVRAAPGNSLPLDSAMCAFNRWAERVGAAPYASRRLFSRAVTRHGVERSQHGSHNAPILHDLALAEGLTR